MCASIGDHDGLGQWSMGIKLQGLFYHFEISISLCILVCFHAFGYTIYDITIMFSY